MSTVGGYFSFTTLVLLLSTKRGKETRISGRSRVQCELKFNEPAVLAERRVEKPGQVNFRENIACSNPVLHPRRQEGYARDRQDDIRILCART